MSISGNHSVQCDCVICVVVDHVSENGIGVFGMTTLLIHIDQRCAKNGSDCDFSGSNQVMDLLPLIQSNSISTCTKYANQSIYIPGYPLLIHRSEERRVV